MNEYETPASVKDAQDQIWNVFKGKLKFLATHFSCGTPGLPGYIMKSAAQAQACRFDDWAGGDPSLHAKVIIRHARHFQRGVTVPALLAKQYLATRKSVVMTFRVRRKPSAPLVLSERDGNGCVCFSIEISARLASVLCPDYLLEDYLRKLYGDPLEKRRSDRLTEGERPFDLPRYEAFGMLMLINRSKRLEEVVQRLFPNDNSEMKDKVWSLVGTLQSALLYFEGGRDVNDQTLPSGFACAFPLLTDRDPRATPFGFCLGSPVTDIIIKRSHEISNLLTHSLMKEVDYHLTGKDLGNDNLALCEALAKVTHMDLQKILDIKALLENEITSDGGIVDNWVARFEGQKKRLLLIGLWLMYLVSKLYGTKHERRPLDFWFVAGEQTEFADDPDVRFDKHPLQIKVDMDPKPDEVLGLEKFDRDGKVQLSDKHCDLIVRYLEKEHYPWFSQGRCSLFFDISTEKLKPSGLAELRLGSWNRLVTESLTLPEEQGLNIPACLIAFVNGASGEAGLLVCYPKRRDGDVSHRARVKRILSLKGGKWQRRSDNRQSTLKAYFQELVPWLKEDKDAIEMSEMATMVADDINAGGTLVFLNDKEQFKPFIQLGAPWEFEELQQDKLALISHDGATIVWKDGKGIKMAYRQLLTHENVGDVSEIIGSLQKKCLWGNDPQFPLLGAGTRRWNAALCALRNDVDMVVVISTDGDITCWWARNDRREFCYHHIPVDFDPETHDGHKDILAP